MFTGIITDKGRIASLKRSDNNLYAEIHTNYDSSTISIGASIACDGVCLTVKERGIKNNTNYFTVDISKETLEKSNLSKWKVKKIINLERALKMGDELGGHLVSGHVDCTIEIASIEENEDHHILSFNIPKDLEKFISKKGSVVINGISLTVNNLDEETFYVNIIPHTWQQTNFSTLKVGEEVNFEIDLLARYIERLIEHK